MRLRAEIHDGRTIRFRLTGADRPREIADYRLLDGAGTELAIEAILPNTAEESVLVPAAALDPDRVHHLEIESLSLRALVRRDPAFRNLYSSKELGAIPGEASTLFRIFSPRADAVRLYLYETADAPASEAVHVVELLRDDQGVWEADVSGDRTGLWYDFTVHGPQDPGNDFFETRPVHISDPYARVNDDAFGKSRVWRDGPPPPPVAGGRPAMEDVVAYEVHVQDFTDLLPVPEPEVGTIPGMVRPGLTNRHGEAIGFDYLVDLGINVVHLMPVQEFLHYPDDTWREAFSDDPFARAMAIDRENYQWGYRTTHAFAVETRFRAAAEPGDEREQFKALVGAFHRLGICVVIDLVPNHTGENMDGRHDLLHFNVLDRPYYYRTDDDLEHIGPFGNEVKTEERPMVQRWLLDQMHHWVDVLGVDGFRIDLAGQIDKQTLVRAKAELPSDLIVYGEPWIAPSDPVVRENPDWSWYKADAPITFFQDDARNAFQGSPFDVNDLGWAGGDANARRAAMRALANDYPDEPLSTDGISYLDIHDNYALADRYAVRDHNGLDGVRLGAVRIAAGLLLTSAGPIVLHGGTEMLRSKGLAEEGQSERTVGGGTVVFNGREDTYNLRAPNRFDWDRLVPGSDVAEMRDYWRGLLSLRASEYGSVFRIASVPEGHYRFFEPEDQRLLGYLVGEQVLVLANNGPEEGTIQVDLPKGDWRQVGGGARVDLAGIEGEASSLGSGNQELSVAPESFLIWVRDRPGPLREERPSPH